MRLWVCLLGHMGGHVPVGAHTRLEKSVPWPVDGCVSLHGYGGTCLSVNAGGLCVWKGM